MEKIELKGGIDVPVKAWFKCVGLAALLLFVFSGATAQLADSNLFSSGTGITLKTPDAFATATGGGWSHARPAGHHVTTDTTLVLNTGNVSCAHDWVQPKPLYYSTMVNAVWVDPDRDRASETFQICRRCLRHEHIKYFHKWVLNKDEYGELVKLLGKSK